MIDEIDVWFLNNWEKSKTPSYWSPYMIYNYLIIWVQIYEKEIIQTNNLSKNEKIQRNNSAKFEKIQRYNLKSAGQIQLDFLISERSVRGGWDVKSTSHCPQSLCCRAFPAFGVRGGVNRFFWYIEIQGYPAWQMDCTIVCILSHSYIFKLFFICPWLFQGKFVYLPSVRGGIRGL